MSAVSEAFWCWATSPGAFIIASARLTWSTAPPGIVTGNTMTSQAASWFQVALTVEPVSVSTAVSSTFSPSSAEELEMSPTLTRTVAGVEIGFLIHRSELAVSPGTSSPAPAKRPTERSGW